MSPDLHQLPPNLPAPADDGACDHLPGAQVPSVRLQSTAGRWVDLAEIAARPAVFFVYPRTGEPGRAAGPEWDAIPGARGCTPQSCGFRDVHSEFARLGAFVYGLSTQTTEYQREMAERLHLTYPILSDASLALTRALRLPTFRYGDWTLLKRLSLILERTRIVHVIYPVFPSHTDAPAVAAWLRTQGGDVGKEKR